MILNGITRIINSVKIRILILKNRKRIFYSNQRVLKKYKNKFEGKRCFIIGNGPSLTVEDLEKIKNEFSFASNGIFYIYEKTNWRPTFYSVQDYKFMLNNINTINKECSDSLSFFGVVETRKYPKIKNESCTVKLVIEPFIDGYPKFSEDMTKQAYEGLTVTYFNIQLAVYMGFKEIYLIGVDHFYQGNGKDHFSNKDNCYNQPKTDLSTFSYEKANKYAKMNGIEIYNATRGGYLDVFERVDLDSIV